MQIVRHIDEQAPEIRQSVVTLGNFDGIHLGHQALIGGAVADARRLNIQSIVLTFEPHPLKALAPLRAPQMLLTHRDKMQLLQSLGVDMVVIQKFDMSFAQLKAEQFVRSILVETLKATKVWVGRDLRFGQRRQGGVEDLVQWGAQLGFQVTVVEPIMVDGSRVSSSRIRELVGAGRVEDVQPLLGRFYSVTGKVVSGHRRGREIGFPTANILSETEVLPADGIYATLFFLGERRLFSVSSIGFNPTFGAGPRTVETHIFNFDDDIYGESVKVAFVKKLRDEKKFSSVEELVNQIREDAACARTILNSLELRQ